MTMFCSFRLCLAIIITWMLFPCSVVAQTEGRDSLPLPVMLREEPGVFPDRFMPVRYEIYHPMDFNREIVLPEFSLTHPPYGALARWNNGSVSGYTFAESMPGMMGKEWGGFALNQDMGNLSVRVYGEMVRYGYFGGVANSPGMGATLSYKLSDRLSLTVFGSMYSSPRFANPAMAAYVNATGFGGYLDYRIHDRWGVMVGAQTTRSVMTGRRDTAPIVKPYFRISDKNVIGVDVGGILYHLIRSNIGSQRYGNPTIPPPQP